MNSKDQSGGNITGTGQEVKSIRLKTFYIVLAGLIVLIGVFFYFLFNREGQSSTTLPLVSEMQRPRFLFNIYGARGVKLVRPMSVYFDDKEKLIYISNTEGHRIDVFKWQGEYVFSFGGFGPDPGKLSYPYGISRTANGDILVAEAGNRRVQRFSSKGEYLGTILDQPNEYKIEKPGPLYMDKKGNIYIGDLSGGKVVVLDEQGRVIRTFTQVEYPHGIAVDEENKLVYIAGSGAGNIRVYSLERESEVPEKIISGYPAGSEQKGFSVIRGIAVDKLGRLFVNESLTGVVVVFDAEGNYQFSFGSMGYDNGQLLYPNGIDIADNGRIYIADWANNRIAIWGY